MPDQLRIGAAEVDITPPFGTPLAGSLTIRPSKGVDDPLFIKAIVVESGATRLAYVVFDVAMIAREVGDRAVALAAARTGIPAHHIVWSCTHTHSAPYTGDWFPCKNTPDPVDHAWMGQLPERFAQAVDQANRALAPSSWSRARAYLSSVSHNRRMRYRDGREINTWLLGGGEDALQCLGAAGPIDPEIGILAFDDPQGRLQAVIFHFALHANAHGVGSVSGDYPAVVAARLREAFGPQVVTLYMPGACGDINPVTDYRRTGDEIASRIIAQLKGRKPAPGPIALAARRRELVVPYRDWRVDQEARIVASQWSAESLEFFRQNLEVIRARGQTQAVSVVHAWRLGDVAFVSQPGELFVELGMRLKQQSPFPWTYPVELCGDYLGYLVTPQAWKAGGYESLISTVALPSVEGVETIVRTGLSLLDELWGPTGR